MITIIQSIVAIVLIVLILLQERSSGLSGIFGGEGGGFYQTRRGLERVIFWATIILIILLLAISIYQLVV